MTDTKTPHNHSELSKKKTTYITIAVLILAAVVLVWLLFFSSSKTDLEKVSETTKSVTGDQKGLPSETGVGSTGQIEALKKDTDATADLLKNKTLTESTEKPDIPVIKIKSCESLETNLSNFFNEIDKKEYIEPFGLDEPSLEYFTALATQLLDNPPVVVRESDDLFTILKNTAHFFRIIGKDNILLIKTILDREADQIEDVADELYQWTVTGSCSSKILPLNAPLEKMYEYAGFFINTMGGRSYLFRRDSRSRLLVNYYSILIIDRTNNENMNRYGIDIKTSIKQLIQEIETTNNLIYKESYLDTLYALMEKYQSPENFR